jgi:hypothetical protein
LGGLEVWEVVVLGLQLGGSGDRGVWGSLERTGGGRVNRLVRPGSGAARWPGWDVEGLGEAVLFLCG